MIREITVSDLKKEYLEKRDCYEELKNHVLGGSTHRVCALYGLRRTGQSVMIEQMIRELDSKKLPYKYYMCEVKTHPRMSDLKHLLDQDLKNGVKYVFVDEITAIEDFQVACATLSDYYCKCGMRLVIAGTDLLNIAFASTDSLFDRLHFIHTSYIPFGEFQRITHKDINDYFEYGGTLTNEPYKVLQKNDDYLNSAIVNNILHSLENAEDLRRFKPLLNAFYDDIEIESAINKIINEYTQSVTLRAIRKQFKNGALNATINNINRDPYIDLDYKTIIDVDRVTQVTKKALKIIQPTNTNLNVHDLRQLSGYLESLGLLIEIPTYESHKQRRNKMMMDIILQPGLIYNQCEILMKSLADDDNWSKDCGIKDKDYFINRAQRFVKGLLLENDIIANTYINYNQYQKMYISKLGIELERDYIEKQEHDFDKVMNAQRHEVDMIVRDIENNKSYLFEVKYSQNVLDGHEKHLRHEGFNQYIEDEFAPVQRKYVIYTGENMMHDGIQYVNCEDYLNLIYENNKDFDKVIEQLDEIASRCPEYVEEVVEEHADLDVVIHDCEEIRKSRVTEKEKDREEIQKVTKDKKDKGL